jgi:hypothetical protein
MITLIRTNSILLIGITLFRFISSYFMDSGLEIFKWSNFTITKGHHVIDINGQKLVRFNEVVLC